MNLLTKKQILFLMDQLSKKTVYEDRNVRLQVPHPGYHEDKEIAKIQASLSMMLEIARD